MGKAINAEKLNCASWSDLREMKSYGNLRYAQKTNKNNFVVTGNFKQFYANNNGI